MSKVRVLLVGPELRDATGAYGGGTGGYTRNMRAYLDGFDDDRFEMLPCFHSVRGEQSGLRGSFVCRAVRDCIVFVWCVLKYRPAIIHVLGQYRSALPREVAFAVVSRFFFRSFFYEVKAGLFDTCYLQGGTLYRAQVRALICLCSGIGVEGKRYSAFLESEFGRSSTYLPNVCLDSEIPRSVGERFCEKRMRVSFVGFCYDGKGVRELVDGCIAVSKLGVDIDLTLAGAESTEFSEWLQKVVVPQNLRLKRAGKLSHSEILLVLNRTDIFCLPTRHPGEGHNNSVNEALMMGCCVAVTRHGFLQDILDSQSAYFFDDCSPESVTRCLLEISGDRVKAAKRAKLGHNYFKANYTSGVVFTRVAEAYSGLMK